MFQGRFFMQDTQFDDSVFHYKVVFLESNDDKKKSYPVFIKCYSDSVIFFLQHDSLENPASHILFELPLNNQLGKINTLEIIETIKDESVEIPNLKIDKSLINEGYVPFFPQQNPTSPISIIKGDIFLNFLFDFYHSTLFDNWKEANSLKSQIHNNFFIRALKSKGDYLISKKQFLEATAQNQSDYFFSKNLKEAEHNWLQILFNSQAQEFCFSNWFSDVEKELENVLFPSDTSFDRFNWRRTFFEEITKTKNKSFQKKKIKQEWNNIINFYTKRYDFLNSLKLYQYENPFNYWALLGLKIITLLLLVLSLPLFFYYKSAEGFFLIGMSGLIISVIAPLILYIYAMFSAWREKINNYPYLFNINAFVPKMSISILAGWISLIPFSEELWELNALSDLTIWCFKGFTVLLAIIITFTISQEIKYIEPISKPVKSFKKIISFFAIGISYSIGIGVIVLHISSNYIYSNPKFFPASKEQLTFIKQIKNIDAHKDSLLAVKNDLTNINFESKAKLSVLVNKNKNLSIGDFLPNQILLLDKDTIENDFNSHKSTTIKKLDSAILNIELNSPLKIKEIAGATAIKIGKKSRFPIITYLRYLDLFVFPRLLVLNALIAFVLGFILQFIMEANIFRETT